MEHGEEERAKIRAVADALRGSGSVLFITGAGLSADSGLPTYRGVGGLYNDGPTEDGIPVEMALAGEMLRVRPDVTWKYILQMEEMGRGCTFNRGHEVIAEMERHFERVWVLTQNVDGFHRAAGSRNVIDIHGDMHDLFCPACGWRKTVENYLGLSVPPPCPECGAWIRPDVVFFGESLSPEKVGILSRELSRGFDAYFSVGTTSVFPYISQPMLLARRVKKMTVEINPTETEISRHVDIQIPMRAAKALDAIWARCLDSREE